jgi:hypothetical protein
LGQSEKDQKLTMAQVNNLSNKFSTNHSLTAVYVEKFVNSRLNQYGMFDLVKGNPSSMSVSVKTIPAMKPKDDPSLAIKKDTLSCLCFPQMGPLSAKEPLEESQHLAESALSMEGHLFAGEGGLPKVRRKVSISSTMHESDQQQKWNPRESTSSLERQLFDDDHTLLLHNVPPHHAVPTYVMRESEEHRFKPFHEEKWNSRLQELKIYVQENGSALVPHTFPPNPQLARWVKRQRRQYKIMQDGGASTMTQSRVDLLNHVDFVWDSHEAAWEEKLHELDVYRRRRGNCLVPSNYAHNPQLATWVKCQRRQNKLFWAGQQSAMTKERILKLNSIGFEWEIRCLTSQQVKLPAVMEHTSDDEELVYAIMDCF